MTFDLQLKRISKTFGATQVLRDVSLEARPGEFISLVGSSGCGKSTLLRIIAGLEAEDAGSIEIAGNSVGHLSPRDRNIAMVFQNYALYPHMTVTDNISLPLRMSQLNFFERLPIFGHLSGRRSPIEADIAQHVAMVASQLGIGHLLNRKPGQLSGGQRQRVALARALVRKPSLFLMDEPLSNLDAQLRVHMREEIADLHRQTGTTFIYVTHDQIEAMTMSDRIAMMEHGRIAQVGTPADLYDMPSTLSVARFIGSPGINVISVNIGLNGRVAYQGAELNLITKAKPGAASLGIRPEHVRFTVSNQSSGLTASIKRCEHHGADQLIYAELHSPERAVVTSRVAQVEANTALSLGTSVSIHFNISKVHVFDEEGYRIPSVISANSDDQFRLAYTARAS